MANRISNVRTWSYVANKKDWVENADYWIQLTKSIEDNLSDRLTRRTNVKSFIDKKISILARGLKQDIAFRNRSVGEDDRVLLDKQYVGELKRFKIYHRF